MNAVSRGLHNGRSADFLTRSIDRKVDNILNKIRSPYDVIRPGKKFSNFVKIYSPNVVSVESTLRLNYKRYSAETTVNR